MRSLKHKLVQGFAFKIPRKKKIIPRIKKKTVYKTKISSGIFSLAKDPAE